MTEETNTNDQNNNGQTIIINQQEKKSNKLGTTGFVLALIGLVLCWIPFVNWILWILGVIFSFIGVFKRPKGLAIAGLIISGFWILVMFVILSALGIGAGALSAYL